MHFCIFKICMLKIFLGKYRKSTKEALVNKEKEAQKPNLMHLVHIMLGNKVKYKYFLPGIGWLWGPGNNWDASTFLVLKS